MGGVNSEPEGMISATLKKGSSFYDAVERPELVGGLVIEGTPAKPDPRIRQIQQSRKLMQKRMEKYEYQPALIVIGEDGISVSPYHGRILAEGIPNANLVVLPGPEHLCCFEDPRGFAELTASFSAK
jgi:hypothetical protein